ncbi:hypothetical protein ACIODW_03450 [Streptomyces sp. NPDC087897]|uniref:hypothetical protein n=1 Tax=Streptomyces sp. NPDC087897 TaxID=3365817 RepID=UPI003819A180
MVEVAGRGRAKSVPGPTKRHRGPSGPESFDELLLKRMHGKSFDEKAKEVAYAGLDCYVLELLESGRNEVRNANESVIRGTHLHTGLAHDSELRFALGDWSHRPVEAEKPDGDAAEPAPDVTPYRSELTARIGGLMKNCSPDGSITLSRGGMDVVLEVFCELAARLGFASGVIAGRVRSDVVSEDDVLAALQLVYPGELGQIALREARSLLAKSRSRQG